MRCSFLPLMLALMGLVVPPDYALRGQTAAPLPVSGYTVVKSYPHDRDAFTQGLQYVDGFLYEGTGLYGRSSIRKVKLETGEVVQSRVVPAQYFGEGIAVLNSEIYQLTWQSGLAFVYDRATLAPRRTFRYTGEGWGLTHDGVDLIMSDGTDTLRFIEPATFKERRRVKVTTGGTAVRDLNELEHVKGEVLANIWMTDRIVRIDPKTGRAIGWIDLSGLLPPRERTQDAVLNGIAYDIAGDRLFVTGKLWPRIFEIRLRKK